MTAVSSGEVVDCFVNRHKRKKVRSSVFMLKPFRFFGSETSANHELPKLHVETPGALASLKFPQVLCGRSPWFSVTGKHGSSSVVGQA